jgi:predicted nucleic acid-binding protein
VDEASSDFVRAAFEADDDVAAWWGTAVECESALARREREGTHTADEVDLARRRLDRLADAWHEVEPTAAVRTVARLLLRVHVLSAADSLQLAAAIVVSENERDIEVVTLDEGLLRAARTQGFEVLG